LKLRYNKSAGQLHTKIIMANQITHVALAEKMSDEFRKFNRDLFIVGTIFPDIRYLKVIDRQKTHFYDLKLEDILSEDDSFIAGMKYHSLTDKVRERYMAEKNIYDHIPSSRYITQALKTYEDEIFYSRVADWEKINGILGHVFDEEMKSGINKEQIEKWHSLIRDYFKQPPTDVSRENFMFGIGFLKEESAEINSLIGEMRQNNKVRETVLEMYINWNSFVLQKKT
jgi:hypothetical protein